MRELIRRWLGIPSIESKVASAFKTIEQSNERSSIRAKHLGKHIDAVDKQLQDLDHRWASLSTQSRNALERAVKLNNTGKQILEHFNLAIDANMYGDSWAVFVAANEKQPRVYFIDLRGATVKDIEEMVNRYNGIHQTVDTPYGMPTIKPLKRL